MKPVPGAEKAGDHCPKEMLLIIRKGHLWEPCLPGKERQAEIPLFNSQETSCPAPAENDYREEEVTTSPPEADQAQN